MSSGNAFIISSQSVRPLRTPASCGRYETSVASWTLMSPSSAGISPAMILSRVDLPAPLTPTRATLSRSPISNVTPSRAWWPPYAFLISCTRSIGVAPGGFRPGESRRPGRRSGAASQAPGARQRRLRARLGRIVRRRCRTCARHTGHHRGRVVCPTGRNRAARPTVEYTRRSRSPRGGRGSGRRTMRMESRGDGLVALLREQYALVPPVTSFGLEHAGLNNVNTGIRTGAGTFVARLHDSLSYEDAASVAYEHCLLGWLAGQGLSFAVPMPIPTRDGASWCEGPDGRISLAPKLPGLPLALQADDAGLLGSATGELQVVMARHPAAPRPDRPLYDELFRFASP